MSHQSLARPSRVIIVGAGGQGRIVADTLMANAAASGSIPVGFVDDRPDGAGMHVMGLPVLGTVAELANLPHDAIVVAIGDNGVRHRLSIELEQRGEHIMTARHPFSSVGLEVTIGRGGMVSAGAVITPCARIGRGVIVNTHASIDHESVIDDFAHVSVGAVVGANVTIGARTLIGLGASVMSGRRIGADCVVGAGALVARDLPDNVVAVGVPARIRRQHP